MARKVKVKLGNEEVDGMEMDFEIVTEQWSEYRLLDGGVIRLKTTPLQIVSVLNEDGQPRRSSNGDPIYVVNHKSDVVFKG